LHRSPHIDRLVCPGVRHRRLIRGRRIQCADIGRRCDGGGGPTGAVKNRVAISEVQPGCVLALISSMFVVPPAALMELALSAAWKAAVFPRLMFCRMRLP
jgi:hypothetical protein